MKRTLAVLFVCGVAVFAHEGTDHEALEKAMKTIGANMGPTKKALDAGSADVAANAKALEGAYADTLKYWKKAKAADAIGWSQDGLKASKALGKAAAKKDVEMAKAEFAKIGGTCKGCHTAHREKAADGSYKIK